MMRGQPGFWDLDERYKRLSAVGDLLEKLNAIILVVLLIPCLRQPSRVDTPASCSRSAAIICSSENLDRFMVRSFPSAEL